MKAPSVLVVDHRDSFVFNLVDDLQRLGARTRVVRSAVSLQDLGGLLVRHDVQLVVLSPGPGHPREAGVFLPFLESRPAVPVLGVCLGLQAMVCALGGAVGPAPRPVHGRATRMHHEGAAIFAGIASGFAAGRYHSLVATDLAGALEPCAWTADDHNLVMAVQHHELPWVGLQFHPESVLTPRGPALLKNILRNLCP